MNNFNKVFQAVKTNCENYGQITDLGALCSQTHMDQLRLKFYLTCLSEIGVLDYSDRHTIILTSKGKDSQDIFEC